MTRGRDGRRHGIRKCWTPLASREETVAEGYTRWSRIGQVDRTKRGEERQIRKMTRKKGKEKEKRKEKPLSISKEDFMGTTESLEQQEGKPECAIQKEHRGQHEGTRPQSEDHAGT